MTYPLLCLVFSGIFFVGGEGLQRRQRGSFKRRASMCKNVSAGSSVPEATIPGRVRVGLSRPTSGTAERDGKEPDLV